MKTNFVRTSLMGLALLAALLLLTPRQAHAASSCTSSFNGNYAWTTTGWTCGHVPGTGANVGDDVTINSSVSLDTDVSIGSFTVSSSGVFGANASGRSMTVTGNWAYNSYSSLGSLVTTVTFAGTSAQTISFVGSKNFYDLVINNPTSVSLTSGSSTTLDVTHQLTISSGTFYQNSATLSFYNASAAVNFVNNGIFDGGSGQVNFQATNTTISGSGTTTFHEVGGGSTLTLPSGTVYVTGNWQSPTTVNPNNGTVVMSGTGTQLIQPGSAATFYNLTINSGSTLQVGGGSLVTIQAGGTLRVNGTLTFPDYCSICSPQYGLVRSDTTGTSSITMGANGTIRDIVSIAADLQSQSGGTLDTTSINTSGTVEYVVSGPGNPSDRNYNNLTISHPTGGWWTWTLAADRTINGNLTIGGSNELILVGGHMLNVQGNLALTSSSVPALNAGTTIVNLNGSALQTISGNSAYSSLTINNPIGVSLGSNTKVNGALTISAGTFSLDAYTLTLYGNWVNNSTFDGGTGTVSFGASGTSNQTIGGASPTTFNHLTINDSPYSVTLNQSITVNGNVTLTSGTLAAGAYTMTVKGNWTQTGGTFSPGTGTVVFNGTASPSSIQTITGATTFNNLTIADGAIVETGNYTTTVGGTFSNGATGAGQIRRTPTSTTACGSSEKDATNINTITLAGCSGISTVTIRTAEGGGFPNVDLTGSLKYDTCPASSNLLRRFWQMTPSSGTGTATVTLAYRGTSQELNSNDPNTLQVFKCEGGSWVKQSGIPTYGTVGAYNTVTLSGVSIGSGYALGSNNPTVVTLSKISARVIDNDTLLFWIFGIVVMMIAGGSISTLLKLRTR